MNSKYENSHLNNINYLEEIGYKFDKDVKLSPEDSKLDWLNYLHEKGYKFDVPVSYTQIFCGLFVFILGYAILFKFVYASGFHL